MKPKSKIVSFSAMNINYLTCPHCKKIILEGKRPDVEVLTSWKKQPLISIKKSKKRSAKKIR